MKKLYIETYGCQMNVADSEVVASVMQMAGYDTCDSLDEADAVFLNTCSVRDNAEQKILNRLETLNAARRGRKRLIIGVLGCMAERVKQDLIDHHHADLVAGPDAYLTLPDLIAQAETGHKAVNIELSATETYRDVVPRRLCGTHVGGFVSIMRGCNNFCHYCIVPYTRGRERSRDPESILREVRDLHDRGYKEVTLLGQNVNSYRSPLPLTRKGERQATPESTSRDASQAPSPHGEDRGGAFPELLALVAETFPDMRVRFTTSHPKDMSDETLAVIAAHPNICRHIHLPVQRRPGTYASRHLPDDVPEEVKLRRLAEMIDLQTRLSAESNARDVGREFDVLVEGFSKRSRARLYGRTSQNKVVVFDKGSRHIGDTVRVRITSSSSATLMGEEVKS